MDGLMQCTITATCDGHLVAVAGEVDMTTAPALTETLVQFANGAVVADLSAVTFLDSSGLDALVVAHQHVQRRGGEFVIRGATPNQMRAFELSSLDRYFTLDRCGATP